MFSEEKEDNRSIVLKKQRLKQETRTETVRIYRQ